MSLAELLDKVVDLPTFAAFVWALVEERERAQQIERAEPERYFDGALDWKNADIANYLGACMSYFEMDEEAFEGKEPTWRDLAEFLYHGKIWE